MQKRKKQLKNCFEISVGLLDESYIMNAMHLQLPTFENSNDEHKLLHKQTEVAMNDTLKVIKTKRNHCNIPVESWHNKCIINRLSETVILH